MWEAMQIRASESEPTATGSAPEITANEPMELEPSPSPEPYMRSLTQTDLPDDSLRLPEEEVEEYFTPQESGPFNESEEALHSTCTHYHARPPPDPSGAGAAIAWI